MLADLGDTPEEGVFVGRVSTVPLDDGVDPAVLGEVHDGIEKIGEWGDMGAGFTIGSWEIGSCSCSDVSSVHRCVHTVRLLPVRGLLGALPG